MSEAQLDLLILGATGFTGIHCIPYVYKFVKENGKNLTWGVSGRSEKKLRDALDIMGKKVGADLSKTPIVITDIKNEDSLLKMAQITKVVINCCGPYRFLGLPVVKACVAAGTNYVDVSGEPQFIETVALEYKEAAREKGIYIVNACGLDSLPYDLGLVYLESKFEGVLNSAVTSLETWIDGESTGPIINYGTWHSLIYGMKHVNELSNLRKKLYPTKLPTFTPKLKVKRIPHRSKVVDGWALPFPSSDRSVIKRTQRYFYEKASKRPVQIDTLIVYKNFFQAISVAFSFVVWMLLVKFNFGKQLLLDYPHIFTFGMFRKNQTPSEELIDNTWFQITFYGEGWNEKLADPSDQYTTPPNKNIIARIKGKNPGYGTTCACVVGSAIMIATEKDKLPSDGGVYTPGVAFQKTSLMKLLMDNGLTFNVLKETNL